ncbi:MAG TPA: hypothetical protein VGD39_12255, partial [Nocardioides sp.]
MSHSPENSERILKEITEFQPDSPFVEQANQLAEIVEQIAEALCLPHGSDVADVVLAAKAAYLGPRNALGLPPTTPALAVNEEIERLRSRERELTDAFDNLVALFDLAAGGSAADAVTHVTLLKDEAEDLREQVRAANARVEALKDEVETHRRSYAALDSEANSVREVLGLSVRDASATEVLDRLRGWKQRADSHRSTMLGLATGLGMKGEPTGTEIGVRFAQLQALVTQIREALDVPDDKPMGEVLKTAREYARDAATLEHLRAHVRLDGGTHRQDVEQAVALLQAEADSVREHLFLPREAEGWQVTKAIKDLRQHVLDSAMHGKPAPIIIPFDTLPPEAQ